MRRPKAGREAYFPYVESPEEGANKADGPLSAHSRDVSYHADAGA
jgi:hypothetical protein